MCSYQYYFLNYGYVWDVNTCVSKEIILVATHVIVTMDMYGMLIHVLGHRDCDRMVVGFTTTYVISAYHH
jgi:hypothetical protein